MDITVIGAGGAVGYEVVHLVIAERLLECGQQLLLVGNPHGASAKSLPGFAVDLMDAYAEVSPSIEVVTSPDEVRGDVIVMAGGATIPPDQGGENIDRGYLAQRNLPVFEQYASALAKHGRGHEIVICISNPNELAVAVFAKHLGRKRVIGMGAFLDSLRFRKEIAYDLGIRRQRIHGFMIGEHGLNSVPLWSNVHIYGLQGQQLQDALARIRKGYETARFFDDVMEAVGKIKALIAEGKIRAAFAFASQYPPDIRVVLKPFVTHFSGSKTVMGTAKASTELIRMMTLGHDTLVSGQISLEGEFHGIHGTIGTPFVIGNQGVDRVIELGLDDAEKTLLLQSVANVQQKLDAFL